MAALAAATLRSCPPLHSENLQPACASHWPADQATLPGDRRPGVFAVSIFRSQHHRDQQRWLEYYLLLGVTHFVLVDNNCDSTHSMHATQTLAPYVDRGLVTHFIGFRCAMDRLGFQNESSDREKEQKKVKADKFRRYQP